MASFGSCQGSTHFSRSSCQPFAAPTICINFAFSSLQNDFIRKSLSWSKLFLSLMGFVVGNWYFWEIFLLSMMDGLFFTLRYTLSIFMFICWTFVFVKFKIMITCPYKWVWDLFPNYNVFLASQTKQHHQRQYNSWLY